MGADGTDLIQALGEQVVGKAYDDLAKPTLQPLGEAVAGLIKAITFYPRYWSQALDISLVDKVKRFEEKLKQNIEEIRGDRQLPPPEIVGPSIQALEYKVFDDEISDLFSKLIATSMDVGKKNSVHPAFVDIIKQMTSDEARIIRLFSKERYQPALSISEDLDISNKMVSKNFNLVAIDAGCDLPEKFKAYLENLERLGLIYIMGDQVKRPPSRIKNTDYSRLENSLKVIMQEYREKNQYEGEFHITRKLFDTTRLGKDFIDACVKTDTGEN